AAASRVREVQAVRRDAARDRHATRRPLAAARDRDSSRRRGRPDTRRLALRPDPDLPYGHRELPPGAPAGPRDSPPALLGARQDAGAAGAAGREANDDAARVPGPD